MDPLDMELVINPVETLRKQNLEEKKYDNTWTSCCIQMDKRAAMFFSQLAISLITIFFCLYQLINVDTCEAQSLYSSLLTLVLGVYLPSPKISK
jgi:hypothetical protein